MRSNGKVVVPITALRPLLRAWVDKQDLEEGMPTGYMQAASGCNKGIGRLSQDSGISARRISGILNGTTSDNVHFDTADKLLCAMQMNSEWHSSLAEFYVELEVAPYERDRDVPVLVTA